MKRLSILLTILILLISNIVYSQVSELWFRTYNGPSNMCDEPDDIAVDNNHNVYVTGQSQVDNIHYRNIAIKYNSLGEVLWTAKFDSVYTDQNRPSQLLIDNSGNVYVTGYTDSFSGTHAVLIKYDQNGNIIWKYIQRPFSQFINIHFDNSGNLVIAGNISDTLLAVKLNPSGTEIWAHTFFHAGYYAIFLNSSAISSSGNIIMAGFLLTLDSNKYVAFASELNSSGIQQWFYNYNPNTNQYSEWNSVAVDQSENVFLGGGMDSVINYGMTAKFDHLGNKIWLQLTPQTNFWKLLLDVSDNLYVTGSSNNGNGASNFSKFDNSGNLLFSKNYYLPNFACMGDDIKIDSSGIYICSENNSMLQNINSFTQVTKYSQNGDSLWSTQKTGTPLSGAQICHPTIAIDNSLNVYLATTSLGAPLSNDYWTSKYCQGLFTVSGHVTFKDNGQTVDSGYVKALYYDYTTAKIITVDSTTIQSGGSYILHHIPQDSVDIMFYQNDEDLDFVPTYYPSTTDWKQALKIYATGNLSGINGQVYRINGATNPYSIRGMATSNSGQGQAALDNAIIYVKSGNTYKNYGISNGSGSFTADKLTPGSYTLTAYRMGFNPVSQNVTITNSNVQNINFNFGSPIGIQPISAQIPKSFNLYQNYPNPFNPETVIKFDIPKDQRVKIIIYDITGREVNKLLDEEIKAGTYNVRWNGSNYASGVYFYRIETGSYTLTKKMLMVK